MRTKRETVVEKAVHLLELLDAAVAECGADNEFSFAAVTKDCTHSDQTRFRNCMPGLYHYALQRDGYVATIVKARRREGTVGWQWAFVCTKRPGSRASARVRVVDARP